MSEKEVDRLRRELAEAKEQAAEAVEMVKVSVKQADDAQQIIAEAKGVAREAVAQCKILVAAQHAPQRRRLPDERDSVTRKFKLPGEDGKPVKGYMTMSFYSDGVTPGEIFLVIDKGGSTVRGLTDALATIVSIALQYGVPFDVLATKLVATKFAPAGFTGEGAAGIEMASSVLDYTARRGQMIIAGRVAKPVQIPTTKTEAPSIASGSAVDMDAPMCRECGGATRRSGSCFACTNCGSTTGCS